MNSRLVATESGVDQVKTSVSNQVLDFDSLSLSVTDLSDAFDSLEQEVQGAIMTPSTSDSSTAMVSKNFQS